MGPRTTREIPFLVLMVEEERLSFFRKVVGVLLFTTHAFPVNVDAVADRKMSSGPTGPKQNETGDRMTCLNSAMRSSTALRIPKH